MPDLDKAVSDISTIRSRIAEGMPFRGFGPAALAASGGLALLTALAQSLWLPDPTGSFVMFLGAWGAAAAMSLALIGIEMRRRARRHHDGLADTMIHQALEAFLPAAAAGIVLPLILMRFAPEAVWMIPGLWQLVVGLGIFASARSLPRPAALVGAWYFVAGCAVLMLASGDRSLSPWAMGLPFVAGQLAMAAIVHAAGKSHAED